MKSIKTRMLWFADEAPMLVVLSTITTIAIILAVIIVEASNFIHRSGCLSSQNPRRWHNAICEEYHSNEWIEISPYKDINIYYNDRAVEK